MEIGAKQVEQGDRGTCQGGEHRVDIEGQQGDGQHAHGGGGDELDLLSQRICKVSPWALAGRVQAYQP